MTMQTKLEMTEKNLLKNMKRLNVQTEVASRELLKYAYTQNGVTLTTDSHKALKLTQTVENEFTKENAEHFEKIEKLLNNFNYEDYYVITLYRDDMDKLRKAAKFIKSMPTVSGRLKTTHFKYVSDDTGMSVSVTSDEQKHFSLNVPLINFNSSFLSNMNNNITTSIQAEFLADMMDFAYDSKLPIVQLYVDESRMKPIKMVGEGFEYIALPVRIY